MGARKSETLELKEQLQDEPKKEQPADSEKENENKENLENKPAVEEPKEEQKKEEPPKTEPTQPIEQPKEEPKVEPKEEPKVEQKEQPKEEIKQEEPKPVSNGLMALAEGDEDKPIAFEEVKKARKQGSNKVDFDGFYEIAEILNQDVIEVVENCYLYQLRKIMSRVGKVIVRYNLSSAEIGDVLYNTKLLNMKEVMFSPAFLPACRKEILKAPEINQTIGAIIDFPFGESSVKSKLLSVKECLKQGVDSATVMLPSMLFEKDKIRELKQQIKKVARLRKLNKGVAVSAMDINELQIKTLMKYIKKYKVNFVTYIFGTVTEYELKQKINEINQFNKGKKELRILANIDTIKGITELTKLNVDVILTPFADNIGKELVKKFKIKSINLI